MNSVLFFDLKLYQKIFLRKMVTSTDPFSFRDLWSKTQVVPLSFWRALTLGEMQIFAGQELDERIDTNVISACWKWSCGQQPLGFSSTFRLETGNRAVPRDTMQQLSYCCSQIKDVCQNKDSWSKAGRSRKDIMSSILINKYSLDGLFTRYMSIFSVIYYSHWAQD